MVYVMSIAIGVMNKTMFVRSVGIICICIMGHVLQHVLMDMLRGATRHDAFSLLFSMVGNVCERMSDDNTFLRSWGNSLGTPPSSSLNLTLLTTNCSFVGKLQKMEVIAWGDGLLWQDTRI